MVGSRSARLALCMPVRPPRGGAKVGQRLVDQLAVAINVELLPDDLGRHERRQLRRARPDALQRLVGFYLDLAVQTFALALDLRLGLGQLRLTQRLCVATAFVEDLSYPLVGLVQLLLQRGADGMGLVARLGG